jgi:hypothetical protein
MQRLTAKCTNRLMEAFWQVPKGMETFGKSLNSVEDLEMLTEQWRYWKYPKK